MITHILFDLDGTLRHSKPTALDLYHEYLVEQNVIAPDHDMRPAIRWAHSYWTGSDGPSGRDKERFGSSTEAFWLNYATQCLLAFGCTPKDAETHAPTINNIIEANYGKAEHFIPDDVFPTLQTLKDQGYPLAILTNRSYVAHDLIDELGLSPYMEFTLFAGEVEIWKPDPVIFAHALKKFGAAPENTLYVGDNYQADIVGARRAGLHPVLIDPNEIFPEADCPVIHAIAEVPTLLANGAYTPSQP